jgi:hypothetical protein
MTSIRMRAMLSDMPRFARSLRGLWRLNLRSNGEGLARCPAASGHSHGQRDSEVARSHKRRPLKAEDKPNRYGNLSRSGQFQL